MNRLPETRTLYEMLPQKSAASGKEFARVVNLLLFRDARTRGENMALFDDRAGDFHGLDAFRQEGQKIAVGYQHKFYPSPLSDKHRQDIEASLAKTHKGLSEAKVSLLKWVLVTPQDPVESARRKTGGDVTWFAGLKQKYKLGYGWRSITAMIRGTRVRTRNPRARGRYSGVPLIGCRAWHFRRSICCRPSK